MFSRSPRAVLLWAAAVVLAIVTAVVVASDLATLHRRAHDLGPERSAVVARHDLALGATVSGADVRERRVHSSQLPPGVLGSRDAALGRVVRVPVLRDDYLSVRHLAPRRRHGLDGALPHGTRAMRVVVTDAVRPRRGASVDVIASYEDGAGADATAAAASVVAEGVLVLSTDATRSSEGGTALGVTVLVTPREARELAFASTHGALTLALVPPEEARSG